MSTQTQSTEAVGESDSLDGEVLLQKFSGKWNVADDVAGADVRSLRSSELFREKHRKLEVDEQITRDEAFPASDYETKADESVWFSERYSYAPQSCSDETVQFIEKGEQQVCSSCEGTETEPCVDCEASGTVVCPTCDGALSVGCTDCSESGTVRCQNCRGDGTLSDGDGDRQCPACAGAGETQCSRCAGSGSHTCRECSGDGAVQCDRCRGTSEMTCQTCDGEGRTVVADHGTLEFTAETEQEYETGPIPDRYVDETMGNRIDTTFEIKDRKPAEGESGTYRHKVELYQIPAATLEYSYDGDEYTLYKVDDELRASTYPKSGKRRAVTLIGLAAVLLGGLGVAWWLGYLPV